MLVHISLHQLLLYQMGYLLFNELKQNKTNHTIMGRLKVLQTAFEQLKSYQQNTHFQQMMQHFDFDLDDDELKELDATDKNHNINCNTSPNNNPENHTPIKYLHPFGFGMWLQEQSFINLNWTGTMDDSEATKKYWRQLIGQSFIKAWKKNKITKQNIIEHYHTNSNGDNTAAVPYIDISIQNNSVVKASQFRISLYRNRIFEIQIPSQNNSYFANIATRKSRRSIDHGINGHVHVENKIANSNINQCTKAKDLTGMNLFNTVVNKNTLCIACCILWEPELANNVLKEFMTDPAFDVNGKHKEIIMIKEDSFPPMFDQTTPTPGLLTPIHSDENGHHLELPMVAAQLAAADRSNSSLHGAGGSSYSLHNLSTASSPAPPSAPSIGSMGRFSNISTNTSYTGNGNLQIDMHIDEIYKYLLEMDYSDKKNPVKYEWKLMVDALNAFQYKVVCIDDFTDDDILSMVNRLKEGLKQSIHDQRSGLIKVACHLFVLLAQYRTPLFFDCEFFKFWMVCLLQKCANRDKIRTLPAHNACSDIVACILSFYVNNKDNDKEFLLHKLKEMFIIFTTLWTPKNIDNTWMKQEKSVTQFIKNISLMIKHTAILHQTPKNKMDIIVEQQNLQYLSINTAHSDGANDDEKSVENMLKPIENEDIKEIQLKAFDLFKLFQKQSHKKARECSVDLLINLYQLDHDRTFEFAKLHFVERELKDYLKKLNEKKVLNEQHKIYFDSISAKGTRTRTRIRKGIKKSGKKKKKKGRNSIKSQIKKAKQKNKQSATIPEETSAFNNNDTNINQSMRKRGSIDTQI